MLIILDKMAQSQIIDEIEEITVSADESKLNVDPLSILSGGIACVYIYNIGY